MVEIGEAVGTAVEGALVAGATEHEATPGSGVREASQRGHFHESACLNCGTALVGKHCHQCGQKAHLHRTLRAFLHDLLHGALHFEGKLWTTLPMLVRKPGALTRRYIEGERAKFMSPMALFLFSVFAMFAIFQAVGLTTPTTIDTGDRAAAMREIRAEQQEVAERLASERERLESVDANDAERAAIEQRIAELEAGSEALEQISHFDAGQSLGRQMRDSGFPLIAKLADKWRENPGLMLYKLQANSYKFSWLLIPLSLPFMSLLFLWRREYRAYDHAIFVTYSLTFMTLLFVALSLIGAAIGGAGYMMLAAFVAAPLHIYKQLREAYALSRFSAAWRLVALIVMIGMILVLFAYILFMLGAF